MDRIAKDTGIIILAAGKGTRMKSERAKVLHEILGKPMISYVLKTAVGISNANVIVVVGHQAEEVKSAISSDFQNISFAYQEKQLGTGHAVMCALPYLKHHIKQIVILCGDVPMIKSDSIVSLISKNLLEGYDISVLTVEMKNPTGYGRIMLGSDGNIIDIVEEADASPEQKKNRMVNSGVYCINTNDLKLFLNDLKPNNAQGEYYLTDVVKAGNRLNKKIGLVLSENANETIGINDIQTLQLVESLMKSS